MKKFKIKRGHLIFLGVILTIAVILRITTMLMQPRIKNLYLALGDSLAVGMTSSSVQGKGYVDHLANDLIKNKDVIDYNKQFSKVNQTSSELLKIVEKNSALIVNNQKISINSLLEKAKYVTVSIGFDEIMKLIRLDMDNKVLIYDGEVINRNLDILQNNLYSTLEEIKTRVNENSIFVLGYYFPYPKLINELNEEDKLLFSSLNDHIKEAAIDANVKYVDIASVANTTFINTSDNGYLPNNEGYRYISVLIKNEMKK